MIFLVNRIYELEVDQMGNLSNTSASLISGSSKVDILRVHVSSRGYAMWSAMGSIDGVFSRKGDLTQCFIVSGKITNANEKIWIDFTVPTELLLETGLFDFSLAGHTADDTEAVMSSTTVSIMVVQGTSLEGALDTTGVKSLQSQLNNLKGIREAEVYTAVSSDGGTAPEISRFFSGTREAPSDQKPYLWAYIKMRYTDGFIDCTTPFVIAVKGGKGDKGDKGDTGPKGPPGEIDTYTLIDTIDTRIDERQAISFDSGYQSEDGYIHLTKEGEDIDGFTPFYVKGGGSGGGSGNQAVMSAKNSTGWNRKTVSDNADCYISVSWSSLEDEMPTGNGSMSVEVNQVTKLRRNVEQGTIEINLRDYISVGDNRVVVKLEDTYGNARSLIFNVTVMTLNLSSTFDGSAVFDGDIFFTYVPTASLRKTVHFLLDGEELETVDIIESGRQQTLQISALPHGSHSLVCWFTSTIDGSVVESNKLTYDLICIESGNTTPIIASDFISQEFDQYSTVVIPYRVYDPTSITAEIALNGTKLTVDRTVQQWSYRASEAGEQHLIIACKGVEKVIGFTVRPVAIEITAEDKNLELYLSSYGRSNSEENPAVWESGEVSAEFDGFNWSSNGWMTDDEGISVLRVPNGGTVTIPFALFQNDFRTSGKTIEIEFATRDVREVNPVIFAGDNYVITPQLAYLSSEQSSIEMMYKENEHLRISFVIQKRTEQRLIFVYIDGIMSGVVQYPVNDNFAQSDSKPLVIKGNGCAVDIYNIRVYNNSLTKEQVLNNWIADTQNGQDLINRYNRNDIFNAYGDIVIDQLPKNLPYLILEADELPQYKGDKKTVRGSFVDPNNPDRNFTFENASFDVQGTSSQYYARKNYKGKFKQFEINGETVSKFELRSGAMAVNTFCYKADVASSEGANNVELVRLYHNTCPSKTPAMLEDSRVRWGIDGFPIVIFWNDGKETSFLGKYNFNNDKGTPEVFGFKDEDQSWEFKNNTSSTMLFQSDDLSDWTNDFEARHPDGSQEIGKLQQVMSWVLSTKGDLEKFKMEFENWFDKDSTLFYYLFTEMFLMVDSRAKNMFLTYISDWDKWTFFPYDFDTGLGINNEGGLLTGNSYSYEDVDHLSGGANVFNGQDSLLWNNVRECYADDISEMYKQLRSTGAWSYEVVNGMFEDHQSIWPEAIFNEDAQFKYIDPLIDDGNASYLSMLQGAKTSQRAWWLYNRFEYMDSKYCSGKALTSYITLRAYDKSDITVTPYLDMYTNIKYGSYLVSARTDNHVPKLLECPLTTLNDTEIYIYNADELVDVGDLSGLKVGYADFSAAVRLEKLSLGGDGDYSNENMRELHIGNSTLLKEINIQGCVNLTGSIDLSKCSNLEVVDARRTQLKGIDLPTTGTIKELYLPETLTNLTLINQKDLEVLDIPTYENISTLRLENVSTVVDVYDPEDPDNHEKAFPDENGLTSHNSFYTSHMIERLPEVSYIWYRWGSLKCNTVYCYDDNKNYIGKNDSWNPSEHGITWITDADFLEGTKYFRVVFHQISQPSEYRWVRMILADPIEIASQINEGSRVRLTGIDTYMKSMTEVNSFFNLMDKMSGLDENGNNLDTAQISGMIHIPGTVMWSDINTIEARFPYVKVVPQNTKYRMNIYGRGTQTAYGRVDITVEEREPGTFGWPGNNVIGNSSIINNTDQYAYTVVGLSYTPDGETILEPGGVLNVDHDIYLYPICEAEIRKYTVTFYNGTTLLESQEVLYGSTAIFTGETPTGSAPFQRWNRSPQYVTEDRACYAEFYENPEETISDSWQEITRHIMDGDYTEVYSIGDTKLLDIGPNGKVLMRIVGFDHDDLADGSGKAPITWISDHVLPSVQRMYWSSTTYPTLSQITETFDKETDRYQKSQVKKRLDDIELNWVDPSIRGRIPTVSKKVVGSSGQEPILVDEKMWIPGQSDLQNKPEYTDLTLNEAYEVFTSNKASERIRTKNGETGRVTWWLRDSSSFGANDAKFRRVTSEGNIQASAWPNTTDNHILPAFCLSDEPREIQDDWETIIAYCKAGTAKDHYLTGDWKEIPGIYTVSGEPLKAVIFGFGKDYRNQGSDNDVWWITNSSDLDYPKYELWLATVDTEDTYNSWYASNPGGNKGAMAYSSWFINQLPEVIKNGLHGYNRYFMTHCWDTTNKRWYTMAGVTNIRMSPPSIGNILKFEGGFRRAMKQLEPGRFYCGDKAAPNASMGFGVLVPEERLGKYTTIDVSGEEMVIDYAYPDDRNIGLRFMFCIA